MKQYVLEGRFMRLEGDFHEQAQRVLGFFVGYGWNLHALDDVVNDNTGLMAAEKPFELVWRDSNVAKAVLGDVFDEIVKILRSARGIKLVLK